MMLVAVVNLIFLTQIMWALANIRFSEPIPAAKFFRQCDISESLFTYCDPEFNLAITDVYVGCGHSRDVDQLALDHRLGWRS